MQSDAKMGSPLPEEGLDQAIGTFVRGLIAADYSPRTIEASLNDLRQFAAFLRQRGLDDWKQVTRARVSEFAAALADPEGAPVMADLGATEDGTTRPGDAQDARSRPYARSTIARKLSVVRSFLALL